MDARFTAWTWLTTLSGLLISAAGCELFGPVGSIDPKGKPDAPPADPKIVQATDPADAPASQPAGDTHPEIASYLARLDDVASRVGRGGGFSRTTLAAEARDMLEARQAADAERAAAPVPRSSEPVEPPASAAPNVTITPESSAASADSPPVLANVGARPARAPAPIAGTDANLPAPNTGATPSGLPTDLDELLGRWIESNVDESYQSQLDRRILSALRGDYEAARKPLELVSAEQQRTATRFVEALIEFRERPGGDVSGDATALLKRIDALRDELVPLSELAVPRLVVCRKVVGFGLYDPITPPVFPAGQSSDLVLYCEIHNLSNQKQADNGYVTHFDVKTAVLTPQGTIVHESATPGVRTVWREPRPECFIAPILTLPGALSIGEYVVKVTISDRIGGKVAEGRTTLRVGKNP